MNIYVSSLAGCGVAGCLNMTQLQNPSTRVLYCSYAQHLSVAGEGHPHRQAMLYLRILQSTTIEAC